MRRALIAPSLSLLCLSLLFLAVGCKSAEKRPDAPIAAAPAAGPTATTTTTSKQPDGGPLYFGFDEHVLPPGAQESLREVARYLLEEEQVHLTIEGHCDELGTSEYNLALGHSRALAAKSYLVALGVAEERVKVLSFGEERPAMSGTDEEARARNRRDEMTFFTTADAEAALDDASASLDVIMAWNAWDEASSR